MSESHFEKARQWLRAHNTLALPARASVVPEAKRSGRTGVQRLTWGDVDAFIREYEFDRDEYFEPHTVFRHHHADWQKEFVYADNVRWIAVYWVVGGSEGYYVHVETRESETQKAELVFLGKFWDVARAEQAANMLQSLVNAATW